MRAIILSIGDELILGQIVDTNAAWISNRLVELGVVPEYHQAVADDRRAIAEAVKLAADKADFVIVSGGLGPTPDDLTRQAIADAAGVKLISDKSSLKKLEQFFKERGWNMSENNRLQAIFPAGATVLDNPVGTAPGFSIVLKKVKIVVMPGVPKEMKVMFERHVAPILVLKSRATVIIRKINILGLGESLVAEKLSSLMDRGHNPFVGTTVTGGIVTIRIRGEFRDLAKGQIEMRKTVNEIKKRLGESVFSEGDESLQELVGKMLSTARKTVVTAESCTAGLLSAMLTETPSSSAYFQGGWVVYSNKMKTENLGVPSGLIRKEGAVSEAVARKMAEGALKKAKSDFALALTGIAGPGGGSPEKKVGTVWIALAQKKGLKIQSYAKKNLFSGDRALVRERAAKTALNMLRLCLIKKIKL